jgi:hypothetical protein
VSGGFCRCVRFTCLASEPTNGVLLDLPNDPTKTYHQAGRPLTDPYQFDILISSRLAGTRCNSIN